jgi:hypothetical protein
MTELTANIFTWKLPRARSRAFSFAEVMFAVIILGIGFIMVAAIFPVAIQQTKLTADETTAAAVARSAASALEQLAAGSDATLLTNGSRGPLFPGHDVRRGKPGRLLVPQPSIHRSIADL